MNIIVKSKEALRNDPNVIITDSKDTYRKNIKNIQLQDIRIDVIKGNLFRDSFSKCKSFIQNGIDCFYVTKENRNFWIAKWCVEETFEDNNEI